MKNIIFYFQVVWARVKSLFLSLCVISLQSLIPTLSLAQPSVLPKLHPGSGTVRPRNGITLLDACTSWQCKGHRKLMVVLEGVIMIILHPNGDIKMTTSIYICIFVLDCIYGLYICIGLHHMNLHLKLNILKLQTWQFYIVQPNTLWPQDEKR